MRNSDKGPLLAIYFVKLLMKSSMLKARAMTVTLATVLKLNQKFFLFSSNNDK